MKTDFKVLMAAMGLEIGGAETHVLELCKGLKQMGVDVYVASNGGAYVDELTECGIRHYQVPLHNKNPYNLIVSYYSLKKIIRENGIKLVHAHARIPAFLCGMLKKSLGFRFVTSCHGVYSTELPFKMLSNWGEGTLAVSEDIKRYLIDNYHLPQDNVQVTINGINTERFSPDITDTEIVKEFSLDISRKRVVYVSRLDKEVCVIAHRILECAEEIHRMNDQLDFFIVGGGNDYDEVKRKANEINKRSDKKFIFVTGARTDVNKLVALADIFVGISRAALEAMASGKPVILAGAPGYIGIFDESKLEIGVETNFCCRGCPPADTQKIKNDIVTLLHMPEEDRLSIGMYARQMVQKLYSVDNMAQDALMLYQSVLRSARKVDALILGYYGSKNHGDDILLKAITDDLRTLKNDINMLVISQRPRDTTKEYQVASIARMNIFKIYHVLKDTNLLISGGGTLIQDLTSSKSLLYYLLVIWVAKKRGTKVMLYANGVGPVTRSPHNRIIAGKILNGVDLITLRDQESETVLDDLYVTVPPVTLTADPAFGIKNTDNQCAIERLESIGLSEKKYFCVAIRSWKYLRDGFENEISAFCEYVYQRHGLYALFVPMQPSYDEEISKRVASNIKTTAFEMGSDYSINEILGIIAKSEFVLAMRLHTLIYAAKTGTPVIGLVYDPKVKAMMDRLGQNIYCDVSDFDGATLLGYADYVIENKEEITGQLASFAREAEKKAFLNAEMAMELIQADCF